jgi:hypothetical protein
MSDFSQPVQDYIRASGALFKAGELSDKKMQAVQQMLDRNSENVLNDGES